MTGETTPTGSNIQDILYISNLTRESSTGVVREVEWEYIKYNGRIAVERTGILHLTGSASNPNFIYYDNLTQDIVKGWISGSLPLDTIDAELQDELRRLRKQRSLRKTPW